MNRLQLFEDIHALYVCNSLSYSEDYSMIQPKKEFVNEWKKEKEKVMLIEKMMQEEKKSRKKYVTNKEQRIVKNEPVDEFE